MSCWISCNVCCKHNGRLCMINWQLTMEFLSTERDGAFWVLSRLLWLLLELRVSRFRNNAGGIGECLTPCWSAPPFPLCSLLCALAFCSCCLRSRCENSVSSQLTHEVQCLINKFLIFWAKYLGKSPLVEAWICNNLQPPCEPCIEWALGKDAVLFITQAPHPLLGPSQCQALTPHWSASTVSKGMTPVAAAKLKKKNQTYSVNGFSSLQSSDLGIDVILWCFYWCCYCPKHFRNSSF